MKPQTLLPLEATRVRHWLRALLLCALFSALHGTLGAWIVPVISSQDAVQICTPQGMQWVALDEDTGDVQGYPTASPTPACVLVGAHVAVLSGLDSASLPAPAPAVHAPGLQRARGNRLPDGMYRVLLMSAMRAPPAR